MFGFLKKFLFGVDDSAIAPVVQEQPAFQPVGLKEIIAGGPEKVAPVVEPKVMTSNRKPRNKKPTAPKPAAASTAAKPAAPKATPTPKKPSGGKPRRPRKPKTVN